MTLLTPGFWHSTYWPSSYWHNTFWGHYSIVTKTPIQILNPCYDAYVKQPNEKRYIGITFATEIAEGDSISNIIDYKCYDSSSVDITATMIESPVINGTNIDFFVKAGMDGMTYNIMIRVATANGSICEGDITLYVREIGYA